MTCITDDEDWLFLAVVINLFSRQLGKHAGVLSQSDSKNIKYQCQLFLGSSTHTAIDQLEWVLQIAPGWFAPTLTDRLCLSPALSAARGHPAAGALPR